MVIEPILQEQNIVLEPGDIFSSGVAVLLKALTDKYTLKFRSETSGKHKFYIKARTDTSATNPVGRTYGLKVNGVDVPLKYIEGSAGPFVVAFGSSSWGEYYGEADLKSGLNDLIIETKQTWGGVDFIEIIPIAEPRRFTEDQVVLRIKDEVAKASVGLYTKLQLDAIVASETKKINDTIPAMIDQAVAVKVQTIKAAILSFANVLKSTIVKIIDDFITKLGEIK